VKLALLFGFLASLVVLQLFIWLGRILSPTGRDESGKTVALGCLLIACFLLIAVAVVAFLSATCAAVLWLG
jgi:hypothetical protein